MRPLAVGLIPVVALCAALRAFAQPSPSAPSAPIADSARTSRIQGTASLGRNRPVPGATVIVERQTGTKLFYLTSTDAKGGYRVESLSEGTYDVGFSRDGLLPVTKSGIVVKPPFRGIVEVTMAPAGPSAAPAPKSASEPAESTVALKGIALDAESKPVSDVKIRMVRAGGPADPREMLTGADGSFSVDGIEPGRWILESLGLAFLPLRAELRVTVDSTVKLVLVGQPATYQAPALDLVPREEPIPPEEKVPDPFFTAK